MSEIKHRYRILEAIDQLRRRKARPDVNRICSFMFRRFSVSCGETKSDLQKLIDAEIVIKVDYKGNTSYRNAAKWAMLPNYKNKQVIDSWNTSSILSSAVAELIVLEPDYLDIGVPAPELERHLLGKDNRRFNRKNLDIILKRELDCGTLVKLENGNYFLGEHTTSNRPQHGSSNSQSPKSTNRPLGPKPSKLKKTPIKPIEISASVTEPVMEKPKTEEQKEQQKVKVEENSNSSNSTPNITENGNNVGFRVGGRQKRAKVMFDPSDNNLPKGRRKSTSRQSLGGLMRTTHNHSSSKQSNNSNVSASNNNNNTVVNGNVIPGQPNKPLTIGPVHSSNSNSSSGKLVNTQAAHQPTTALPSALCTLCCSFGIRIKGVPERLISCSDCTTYRAHLSCVDSGKLGSARGRNGLWQCLQCKTCVVCGGTSKKSAAGLLAACSSCGDGYHYICHRPPIPLTVELDISKWKCHRCPDKSTKDEKPSRKEEPPEDSDTEMKPVVTAVKRPIPTVLPSPVAPPDPCPILVSALKTESAEEKPEEKPEEKSAMNGLIISALPTTPASCFKDPYEGYPIDESIPDASMWSPEEVYQYFEKLFDANLVQVFKDQEIDGQSLLLMKRSDVLSGLCLKLGPALKVYHQVKKLQIRRSNPNLLWS